MAIPFSDLQAVAPSSIIELFQLELNALQHGVTETYYFHAGTNFDVTGDITWNSQEYVRYPIEATEFEYSGTGQLPRPKLRVSNIFGTITALLLSLPAGLEGAKVTRIRTLARYIDGVNFPGGTNPYGTPDPTAEFPREIYYVDRKANETRDLVEFELAAVFDLAGVRAPKRQCISNLCQWRYRGPECGYTGNAYFNSNDIPVGQLSLDVCGKKLRSCELRFGQLFRTGTVTAGSNILTLSQPTSFSANDKVTGFGLPANTTVSSVSGNQVTLNNNATATTTVVTTGTVQSNMTNIVVTSATGIAPGMSVTGNYLQPNTQTVAVAGTTISLSAPVDITQFFTSVGTFTAASSLSVVFTPQARNYIFISKDINISAINVGQYVDSSYMPITQRAQVTGFGTTEYFNVIYLSQSYFVSYYFTAPWTFYAVNAPLSATYTFTALDSTYTFRDNVPLPFGSFPGVGTFAA